MSKKHRVCGGWLERLVRKIKMNPILDRIQNYLEVGGLFNPEMMEHEKVRELIMDCRSELEQLCRLVKEGRTLILKVGASHDAEIQLKQRAWITEVDELELQKRLNL